MGLQLLNRRSDVYKRHRLRCGVRDQFGLASRGDSSPLEIAETIACLAPEALLNPEHGQLRDTVSHAQPASPQSAYVVLSCRLDRELTGGHRHRTHGDTASYIKAYFENFHPAFPLLHRPTFSISSSPEILINIVAVIGSLYSTPSNSSDLEACQWRRDTWKRGSRHLHDMVILQNPIRPLTALIYYRSPLMAVKFEKSGFCRLASSILSTGRTRRTPLILTKRNACCGLLLT